VKSSAELPALVPPEVMTNRLHVPALAPPPVVAVISVEETTSTLVAAMAVGPDPLPWPITTLAPGMNPVPLMVMGVPPAIGPELGETAVTVGTTAGMLYVKLSPALAALVPPEVVTKRLKVPALAPPPVVAVISVGETTFTLVAAMAPLSPLPWPMATVAPETNPVPVIVMDVPPVVGPELGETLVTVGVGLLLGVVMRPIELLRFVNHRAPSDPDVIR